MTTPSTPLISAKELSALNPAQTTILDATWIAPFLDPKTKGIHLYAKSHIAGAKFFDIDEIADQSSSLPHMAPTAEDFAAHVGKLGVSSDHLVIVYDQNNFAASARAWWMFRLFGHENIKVLDGGFDAWRDFCGDVDQGLMSEITTNHFVVRQNQSLLVNKDIMMDVCESRTQTVIDARPAARFEGTAPEPREGLKSGHMPGAYSLPHGNLLQSDGRFRSKEELSLLFARAGIESGKAIVTTCGSGVTAAVLALGLAILGRYDVAIYDGSWSEWAADDNCPVVKG